MKVMKSVVVTAAVMAVVMMVRANAVPRRDNRGGGPPCNNDDGLSTLTNLTQELCTATNTTQCQDNKMNCIKQLRPERIQNSTFETQFVTNITACAQQLGYNITIPKILPRPHSFEDHGSGEFGNAKCHQGPEKFFRNVGLSQTQLLPMLRCFMTKNGDIDKFEACINQ
ncbi:uncharacterized protein [Procambarus clarkii]|uniref:uncharacterized protein n=1 Tax=Procambarus clarkii TaxID=6728 RepID=UPI0037442A48